MFPSDYIFEYILYSKISASKEHFKRNLINTYFTVNHSIREPRGVMQIYFNCTPAAISKYIQMNPVAYYQIVYLGIYIHRKRWVRAKLILTEMHWIWFQREHLMWPFPSRTSHPRATWSTSQCKAGLFRYRIPIIKVTCFWDHLIFMEILIQYTMIQDNTFILRRPQESSWYSIIVLREYIQNIFRWLQLFIPQNHTNVIYVVICE